MATTYYVTEAVDDDFETLAEACADGGVIDGDTIEVKDAWDNPDTAAVTVADQLTITATGTARVTTARHVSGAPQHYILEVDGAHCITVNDSETTIDGIDIRQAGGAGDESDEGIRMAHDGGTLNVTNCIVSGPNDGTNDQDGIYIGIIDGTMNVEQCYIYGFARAGLMSQIYQNTSEVHTWNINSCGMYLCGETNEEQAGAFSCHRQYSNPTYNINIHNTWAIDCNYNTNDDFNERLASATATWNISYSIDSDNSIASRDGGGAGNQANCSIHDGTGGDTVVFVEDITGAIPFNLALNSASDSNDGGDATTNCAYEEHSTQTAEGMTIPNNDIDGTSRNSGGTPQQGSNFDVGPFEVVAANGGTEYTKSLADTMTMADSFSDVASFVRSYDDTVSLSDAPAKAISTSASDTVSLADAVSKVIGMSQSDALSFADGLGKELRKGLADAVSLLDLRTDDRPPPDVEPPPEEEEPPPGGGGPGGAVYVSAKKYGPKYSEDDELMDLLAAIIPVIY